MRLIVLLFLFASHSAFAEEESGSSSGFWSKLWGYLDRLFATIDRFVQWCVDLVIEVFRSLLAMLKDLVFWTFEVLFEFAAGLLGDLASTFGLDSMTSTLRGYWSMVPPDVVQVMQAIGVPTALGIVVAGILIRFALQLIPFVRLGS